MAERGGPQDTNKAGHGGVSNVHGRDPVEGRSTPATAAGTGSGTPGASSDQDAPGTLDEPERSIGGVQGSPEGARADRTGRGPMSGQVASSASPEDRGVGETHHTDTSLKPVPTEPPAEEARSFDSGNRPKDVSIDDLGAPHLGGRGDPVEGGRDPR